MNIKKSLFGGHRAILRSLLSHGVDEWLGTCDWNFSFPADLERLLPERLLQPCVCLPWGVVGVL